MKTVNEGGPNAVEMIKETIPNVYANHLDANWTASDITIRFGQTIPLYTSGEQRWGTGQRVAVTLPWAKVKNLRDILVELVKRYEDVNGEIKEGQVP